MFSINLLGLGHEWSISVIIVEKTIKKRSCICLYQLTDGYLELFVTVYLSKQPEWLCWEIDVNYRISSTSPEDINFSRNPQKSESEGLTYLWKTMKYERQASFVQNYCFATAGLAHFWVWKSSRTCVPVLFFSSHLSSSLSHTRPALGSRAGKDSSRAQQRIGGISSTDVRQQWWTSARDRGMLKNVLLVGVLIDNLVF